MGELLHKSGWNLAKLQNPHGAHLAITDATSEHWKDLVDQIRTATKMMKADKSLNQNKDTAVYGMTGMIPDKQFMRKFICMHQAAMLDTVE